ncbi:MAG: ribosome maturation factor RimM [Actinomycetota bacterium]|nr:ribosome maturation factor RimM [Actinomycetota bacterium]
MLLEVGRIVKAHGLGGQVVVELVTNRDERLAPGSVLVGPSGTLEVLRSSITSGSSKRARWIVTFAGITDRNAAEAIRGAMLRAEPLGDPETLWVHELIGSDVVDGSGATLGRVSGVQENPASDLLVLDGGGLIPLRFITASWEGRVTVDIPDGLLDL